MCCLRQNILTLRLSVGGRTDARTDGRKIFTQYSGIISCSVGSTNTLIPLPDTPIGGSAKCGGSAQAPRPCKPVYIVDGKRDLVSYFRLCNKHLINSTHSTLQYSYLINHWDKGSQPWHPQIMFNILSQFLANIHIFSQIAKQSFLASKE